MGSSDNKEKTIKEKLLYKGRILSLYVNDVELPNGKTSIREVVRHKDGAGILTLDGDEFIFVKQYRYAVGKEILEIPAGLVEKGENPKETAIRELQEEVGLKPIDIKQILKIWPSPGFTDEETYIFYASEFEKNQLRPDDDEFIKIVRIKQDEVQRLYQQGFFEDAKTVSALGYYFSEISK